MSIGRQLCVVISVGIIGMPFISSCESDSVSATQSQGFAASSAPASPPSKPGSGSATVVGQFPGNMSVSKVTCDAATDKSALTVQLTGVADKSLLEVSILIDPDRGAGTYDLTKEVGQGGVAISDQTPPGGNWGPAVDPSTATLDSAGTGGTFSVTADRYGYPAVQITGSWNCNKIIEG